MSSAYSRVIYWRSFYYSTLHESERTATSQHEYNISAEFHSNEMLYFGYINEGSDAL